MAISWCRSRLITDTTQGEIQDDWWLWQTEESLFHEFVYHALCPHITRQGDNMSEPLIYIITWKLKEGRLEDYKQFFRGFVERIKAREPQLIAVHGYLNEEQNEVTVIQIHPDADSMDYHMQVVEQVLGGDMIEWVEKADFFDPMHIEIYGTPSADLLEADRQAVEAGLPRRIKPRHLAGFTRTSAG